VLLAAALCARPALLVADEATAHLDERARTEAMDLIAERVTQGMTAIWVSQREEEICRSHRRVTLDREAGLRPWSPSMESAFDPTLAPEAPETADACRILLELEIAPGASAEGPHIEVAEARRVTIPESGIVRVCGPNGCGKTVLLQALAGLVRLDSTRLVRGNWPLRPMFVGEYPEREIFEELVRDEVLFAATRRGETRKRALDGAVHLLDRLGLSGALMIERRTWRLSGGERRLVQLVSTLNAPADLLLLDEPTAGLDPGRRRALGEVLIERARQTPVVVATQQPRWPPGISFRHAVLLGVSGNRQNLAK
jgi:energy-coupling factor transporter ATP-binding protein EcfA2